jgi:hypothetical protein
MIVRAVRGALPSLFIASWLAAAMGGCEPSADAAPLPGAAKAEARVAPAAPLVESLALAVPPDPSAETIDEEHPQGKPRFGGNGPDPDFVLEQIARAQPLGFKSLSPTSAVMRMRLTAPFDAAFKPVTPARAFGAAAEVAAYRLSRCLGMDSVPPAIMRDVPAKQIRDTFEPDGKQRWRELRERMGVTDDGTVRGAAIYWISDLTDIGLDDRNGRAHVAAWLAIGGEIPPPKRSLAESLSTLLAFDYLIGNFDRWSGANAKGDAHGKRVYARDHDLAFPARMSEPLHRRLWDDLLVAQRFSRRFYQAVRDLSRTCLYDELARDPASERGPLLSERQVSGVFDRREGLISHIDSLIALHGEAEVLAFD